MEMPVQNAQKTTKIKETISVSKESKAQFEDLEKLLSVSVDDIAIKLGMKNKNIYQTYRKIIKLTHYKVLIYGVYLLNSGLSTKNIMNAIENAKTIKETE